MDAGRPRESDLCGGSIKVPGDGTEEEKLRA